MHNRSVALLGVVVAVIASLLVAGCTGGGQAPSPSPAAPVRVTDVDNGTAISLARGQTLLVSLEANPSTGYSWVVSALPSILMTVGEPAFGSGSKVDTAIVGAGGTMATTFRATSIGTGKLEMGYRRPWEKEVEPAAKFTLEVTVK